MESAIVKYLCGNLGSTNRDELVANCVFGDASTVNEIISNRDRFANAPYNGEKHLIAKTALRLCRRLVCAGPGYSSLHLWPIYSHAWCTNGPYIYFKEICVLLLQNDMDLLPSVCFDYNNTGCQEGCKRIHICEQYLRRNCCCSRSHDFYEPQPFEVLQKSRIPNDLMAAMKPLYINKRVLSGIEHKAKQAGQTNQVPGAGELELQEVELLFIVCFSDKTEICMYFLIGTTCRHTIERCFQAHCRLPYSWEVLKGHQWTLLDSSEKIEEDYCNPKKTYSTVDVEVVCFDTMTCRLQKVRRLSSISSVLQPTFLLTTEWLWYWEDEHGNWNQYDSPVSSAPSQSGFVCCFPTLTSGTLDSCLINHTRVLSITLQVKLLLFFYFSRRPQNGPTNVLAMPRHWDRTQVPETGHKKVPLQDSSEEYKEVETLFRQTMTNFDIVKIERIQNKSLWDQFQLQREQMKTKNGGRCVAESKLFHGTDSKFIDAICCSNFDWRICGTHGTVYGNGSYFARDASYSHNYNGNASTVRSMFVSRVLVGDHTRGKAEYVRPPSKDGGDTLFYDSCVNDILSPSIFVVFDRPQIYPEFLFTYKERREKVSVFDDWLTLSLTAAPVVIPTPVPRARRITRPVPSATPVPRATPMPSTTRVPSATPVLTPTPVYTPAYVKPTPPPQFYVPQTSRHPFQPPAPDLP
uniref:Poly [ADP-ribose] polymerase n=1 Tax=Gadus morhua TaxID=8049 RepID=A0A8C4Z3T4_GADMO